MKNLTPHEIAKKEKELFEYSGEDRVVSSHEIAERLNETKDSIISYSTGIKSMDRILEDVEAGELIIITGPSGEGKTTLMMTITQNMIDQDIKSVWFTLEVTPRQFIKKMTAREDNKNIPEFYMPLKNTDNHIGWLEDRILESVVKYNCRVVFIDHLHMIFDLAKMGGNMTLEIGQLANKIKNIAVQHNLIIFLVVHNRNNTMQPLAEIRKEDLRDSGLIERAADTIVGVWRINNNEANPTKRPKDLREDDTWSKCKILKNRGEGTMGSWIMDHKNHRLVEINPKLEVMNNNKEADDWGGF